MQEDVDKLESQIACKTDSKTAHQYYECLNKSKDTIDFCYDQYIIGLNNQDLAEEPFDLVT